MKCMLPKEDLHFKLLYNSTHVSTLHDRFNSLDKWLKSSLMMTEQIKFRLSEKYTRKMPVGSN